MKIGIIGAGYVGLVSAGCFSEYGYKVTCVDSDIEKIQLLNNKKIPIYEPGLADLVSQNIDKNRLFFNNKLDILIGHDIIFIAVGTPTARRGDGHADLKYIYQVTRQISEILEKNKNTLIVTKSTVPIGTGKEIVKIISESRKDLIHGKDFHIASNPEFLREGSAIEDFMRPDRVVCGVSNQYSENMMRELYRPLNLREAPLLFTDVKSAELIKYSSNAFLAMKISFINEMSDLCEKVGGDIQSVAKGIGLDNRIGPKFLHPGPGFGGSCFPKDTRALLATFKDNNIEPTLIDAVINFNEKRKIRMVDIIESCFNSSIKNKLISILGITFKPNTDDIREAPSLVIIPELISRGANVKAYDPAIKESSKKLLEFKNVVWCSNVSEVVKDTEALVLLTEWNEFRGLSPDFIKSNMKNPVVIDLRNIFDKEIMKNAGVKYRGIGFDRDNI